MDVKRFHIDGNAAEAIAQIDKALETVPLEDRAWVSSEISRLAGEMWQRGTLNTEWKAGRGGALVIHYESGKPVSLEFVPNRKQ